MLGFFEAIDHVVSFVCRIVKKLGANSEFRYQLIE